MSGTIIRKLGSGISGNGTLDYLTKWTPDGNSLGNSQIFDNGTNIGIGTITPFTKLQIVGVDSTSSNYTLSLYNSSGPMLFVRNDSTFLFGPSTVNSSIQTSGLGGIFGIYNQSTFHHLKIAAADNKFFVSNGDPTNTAFTQINTSNGNWLIGNPSTNVYSESLNDSKLWIQGVDSTSSNYTLKVDNSALTRLFSIRNDGLIIVNNLTVGLGGGQVVGNTVIGTDGLMINSTGTGNSIFGYQSGSSNTIGKFNSFFGLQSGNSNNTADNNTGFGYQSLLQNSVNTDNTAIGYRSLFNCHADFNTAIGSRSLFNLNTGNFNVGLGSNSGFNITSGIGNTVVGHGALGENNNSNCVAIGYLAGYHETGDNKLFIDNTLRASEADGRSMSLVYGVFAASPLNQELHINAKKINVDDLQVGNAGLVTGDLYVDSAANILANGDLVVGRKV